MAFNKWVSTLISDRLYMQITSLATRGRYRLLKKHLFLQKTSEIFCGFRSNCFAEALLSKQTWWGGGGKAWIVVTKCYFLNVFSWFSDFSEQFEASFIFNGEYHLKLSFPNCVWRWNAVPEGFSHGISKLLSLFVTLETWINCWKGGLWGFSGFPNGFCAVWIENSISDFLAMELSLLSAYSISLFLDATRRRAFGLVSQAYTSIVADDFAAFVGLPVEEAVKGTLYQLLRFLQMVRAISGGK